MNRFKKNVLLGKTVDQKTVLHHERLFLEEDVPKVPVKGNLRTWKENTPKECCFLVFHKGLAFRAEGSSEKRDLGKP